MNRDMLSRRLERNDDRVVPAVDGPSAVGMAAMAGDREKALEAACLDYRTRPVEPPRLLEEIEARPGAAEPGGALQ